MRYVNFALLAPIMTLSVGLAACQSNPPKVTDTSAQSPSVRVQKAADKGLDNSSGDKHSNKPFTEIPLITESNRPADQPDAYIPPYGRIDNTPNIEASWRKPAIKWTATDAVYSREWAKSETKERCPILALPSNAPAHLAGHQVRRANFSGGWGVAYDLPNLRSAYGVANAGVTEPLGPRSIWADYHQYADGTELSYGREGGDPEGNWLAYLILGDSQCFYNIWSQKSKAHLEQIITELRVVAP